jgi:hypothetical protein
MSFRGSKFIKYVYLKNNFKYFGGTFASNLTLTPRYAPTLVYDQK